MSKIKVTELFSGIGSQVAALKRLGVDYECVGISEIDKYAMTVANDNYPDIIQCGDAFQLREDNWAY